MSAASSNKSSSARALGRTLLADGHVVLSRSDRFIDRFIVTVVSSFAGLAARCGMLSGGMVDCAEANTGDSVTRGAGCCLEDIADIGYGTVFMYSE